MGRRAREFGGPMEPRALVALLLTAISAPSAVHLMASGSRPAVIPRIGGPYGNVIAWAIALGAPLVLGSACVLVGRSAGKVIRARIPHPPGAPAARLAVWVGAASVVLAGVLGIPALRQELARASLQVACDMSAKSDREVIASLAHDHRSVREHAANACRSRAIRDAVPSLLTLLAVGAADDRFAAAEALRVLAPERPELAPALVRSLGDHWDQAAVASALVDIGPPAIPDLARVLEHADLVLAERSLSVLDDLARRDGATARQVVDALARAMAAVPPLNRRAVLDALACLTHRCADAIRAVAGALADPDPELRWRAAAHIRDAADDSDGPPAALVDAAIVTSMAAICAALASSDPRTIDPAAVLAPDLVRLSPSPATLAPALVAALAHCDARHRASVLEALVSLGPAAAGAIGDPVPFLNSLCGGVDRWSPSVALADHVVARLLCQVEPERERLARLASAVGSWSSACGTGALRAAVARALGRMGPQAVPALPALVAAIADEDPWVRLDVASAISAIGEAGPTRLHAIPTLVQLAGLPEAAVRVPTPRACDGPQAIADTARADLTWLSLAASPDEVREAARRALATLERH